MGVITKVSVGRRKKDHVAPNHVADAIMEGVESHFKKEDPPTQKTMEDLSFAVDVAVRLRELAEKPEPFTVREIHRDGVHFIESEAEQANYYWRTDLSSKVIDSALNKLFLEEK